MLQQLTTLAQYFTQLNLNEMKFVNKTYAVVAVIFPFFLFQSIIAIYFIYFHFSIHSLLLRKFSVEWQSEWNNAIHGVERRIEGKLSFMEKWRKYFVSEIDRIKFLYYCPNENSVWDNKFNAIIKAGLVREWCLNILKITEKVHWKILNFF